MSVIEQVRPESVEQLTQDALVIPSIVPSGEWHRTERNVAIISKLVKLVFQPENILIAHHICFTKGGRGYEIASIETWLFDHETLRSLFSAGYLDVAQKLAVCVPTQRLELVSRMLDM